MTEGGSVRRGRACILVLVTLLAASGSATAADAGTVEARAPVVVDGAGEAVTPNGTLTFLTAETGDAGVLAFTFVADEAVVRIEVSRSCPPPDADPVGAATCHGAAYSGSPEGSRTLTLSNAVITATGPVREDFRAALTVDDQYEATHDAATAKPLRVLHEGVTRGEINAADDAPGRFRGGSTEPAYPGQGAPDGFRAYESDGDFAYDADGHLRARSDGGWLGVALTGLDLRIRGTSANGEEVNEVVRTGTTTEGSGANGQEWTRHVYAESPDAAVELTVDDGAVLVTGFFEATAFDAVRLQDAEGAVTVSGQEHAFAREDATLHGRFTLLPERVIESEDDVTRLAFRVSSASVITPAATPPPPLNPVTSNPGAAAAVAGAGLALVGVAYYWPALRFGAFGLFTPLYSRIRRDDVLEHDTREEIFKMIRTEPGIHAHEIGARAGIGWGTTVYHLRLLEEHRLVTSKRVGRYRRFYTVAGASPHRKEAYAVLRNETSRDVGAFIVKNPGCAQKDVCEALDISPSLTNWHVGKLEAAELVKKVRQGRRVHYYAGPAWNEVDLTVVAPDLAGGDEPLVKLATTSEDPALAGGEN